jgi:outer membrane receptor for ferrienterochelin and colicin
MVERTPGFVLNEGADIRGFGAGAGNVLIDGARPVSKTGGIRQALERIPASAVEYIELQSGTSAGGEAQGHVIIANVRRRGGVTSGTWLVEVEQASDGKVYPRSEFVMSRADGETRQALRLNAFWERFPLQGKRDSYDARGVL